MDQYDPFNPPPKDGCENCLALQKSMVAYANALAETTTLIQYLLDPSVDDQERGRIRSELEKFTTQNNAGNTPSGIIQP